MSLRLAMHAHDWPLDVPLQIARGSLSCQPTLQLQLTDADGVTGWGEACGIPYKGETPASMMADVERVRAAIEAGVTREALLTLLPGGGARTALDSALWDLEAKRGGPDPFRANGLQPRPISSACTIGIRSLDAYEASARALAGFALLKVKVDAVDPVAAIRAVRAGASDARLIVDPNQSWSVAQLKDLAGPMADLGVSLLEQPIPVGAESGLDGWTSPVPLCADELVDTEADLDLAQGRFRYVNIKLDKAGGLTAALRLADAAEARGLGLMVGCMLGSSLSMAPAMVLAQRCSFVDLDGPMLHSADVPNGFQYVDGRVDCPHNPALWG
jgi:L-alanine-DL-glutamate epimerase-like enolase superfamily enzyme